MAPRVKSLVVGMRLLRVQSLDTGFLDNERSPGASAQSLPSFN